MTESETSFRSDIKELTSPKNFVSIVVALLASTGVLAVLNKESSILDVLKIGLRFLILFLCLTVIYFFIRWIFVYRKKSEKKPSKRRRRRRKRGYHIYVPKYLRKRSSPSKKHAFPFIQELIGE